MERLRALALLLGLVLGVACGVKGAPRPPEPPPPSPPEAQPAQPELPDAGT